MASLFRSPLFFVFALWAAGLGAAAQFAKVVVIFPELQAHYGETGAASGYLVSLISFMGMVLGLVTGIIAIQIGLRRLLLIGLILGVAVSIFQATLPPFGWMLASRLLEGLSHLAIIVSAPTLIAQFAADRHQGAALTLWGTFFGVAFAIMAVAAQPAITAFGLGGLSAAHALYMAACAMLLAWALPSHDHGIPASWPSLTDVAQQHLKAYSSPFIAAPALGWLFYTLTFVALMAIAPTLVDPQHRALVAATMPLASILSSITFGSWLLRYLPAVTVIISGFALAILLMLVFALFGPGPWLFIALFTALGLVQGASFAAVPQLNPSLTDRVLGNGGLAQTGNLGNSIGTPIVLAILASGAPLALPLFLIGCYGCAILVHLAMGKRRRAQAKASSPA
ncbi:MFS transporter [Hoeflea sp. G2-23]|uniref:MFS transporter n=1 Tax=Hoeflea algicola TaxID=2983763 RepID=A0ABT3Z7K3_9HYPH|nr:MFS transporter [Hoeflea algicola]MCY0147759.1 MFS transporter [Hoeflea algicola]